MESLNFLLAETEANHFAIVAAVALIMGLVLLWGIEPKSSGPRQPPTKRPLNSCGGCGHLWYPRGHDESPKCPNCGLITRPPKSYDATA